MSTGYVLSGSAFEDICRIWNYLAENASPEIADRIEEQLFSTFETLLQFPNLGHSRADLTKRPVLFFHSQQYIVVYEPDQEPFVIHSVLHGARDLKSILKSRAQ